MFRLLRSCLWIFLLILLLFNSFPILLQIRPQTRSIILFRSNVAPSNFHVSNYATLGNKSDGKERTDYQYLLGCLIREGKRERAVKVLRDVLEIVKKKTSRDPHEILTESLQSLKPLLTLRVSSIIYIFMEDRTRYRIAPMR